MDFWKESPVSDVALRSGWMTFITVTDLALRYWATSHGLRKTWISQCAHERRDRQTTKKFCKAHVFVLFLVSKWSRNMSSVLLSSDLTSLFSLSYRHLSHHTHTLFSPCLTLFGCLVCMHFYSPIHLRLISFQDVQSDASQRFGFWKRKVVVSCLEQWYSPTLNYRSRSWWVRAWEFTSLFNNEAAHYWKAASAGHYRRNEWRSSQTWLWLWNKFKSLKVSITWYSPMTHSEACVLFPIITDSAVHGEHRPL